MSNLLKSKKHKHIWEKSTHKLEDDFSYYYMICNQCHKVRFPAIELQKILDYSKENLFLLVEDWVLLLPFVNDKYIAGITRYQKMLFLIYKKFIIEEEIPTENPGFYGYKYGPYSIRIDHAIENMIRNGYIEKKGRKSSQREIFSITNDGKNRAKKIHNRLSKKQQDALSAFRKYWDQKSIKGILKYIYANYKDYTRKSLILRNVFPDRVLYRKRG